MIAVLFFLFSYSMHSTHNWIALFLPFEFKQKSYDRNPNARRLPISPKTGVPRLVGTAKYTSFPPSSVHPLPAAIQRRSNVADLVK